MPDVFLEDLLDDISAAAYRYAATITAGPRTQDLESRIRSDWEVIRPAAVRALSTIPTLGGARAAADPVLARIADLPTVRSKAPQGSARDEAVHLARLLGVAADVLVSASQRPDFTAEHARAALTQVTSAVGAVSRISAAAAATTAAQTRAHSGVAARRAVARYDDLERACRNIGRQGERPVVGMAPAPTSLASAVARWCATTEAALEPGQVNSHLMRSAPADLRYIHAATAALTHAATQSPSARDLAQVAEVLGEAQTAWGDVLAAWPAQTRTQPGGREDFEQLQAAHDLHDRIREAVRSGPGWATATEIQDRVDVGHELRAIADLTGQALRRVADRYAATTRILIDNEVITFPARQLPKPGGGQGHDPRVLTAATKGDWVPLPATSAPALALRAAADVASLATSRTGTALRPRRDPPEAGARASAHANRDQPRMDPPRTPQRTI